MNWVGGARNRVSCHGERKLQKEFFERKRRDAQTKKSHKGININHSKESSQDIVALKTVDKASINYSSANCINKGNLRKVDLKGYRSTVICPNKIQKIEIPASPDHVPSKIFLKTALSSESDQYVTEDLNDFINKQKKKIEERKFLFSYHTDQHDNQQFIKKFEYHRSQKSPEYFQPSTKRNDNGGLPNDSNSKNSQEHIYLWPKETFQAEPIRKYDICSELHAPVHKVESSSKFSSHDISSPVLMRTNQTGTFDIAKSPYHNHTTSKKLNPVKPDEFFLDDHIQMISTPYRTPQRVPDKSVLIQAPKKSPSKKIQWNVTQNKENLDLDRSLKEGNDEDTHVKSICSPRYHSMEFLKKDFENKHLDNDEFKFEARNINSKHRNQFSCCQSNFEVPNITGFESVSSITARNTKLGNTDNQLQRCQPTQRARKSIQFTSDTLDWGPPEENLSESENSFVRNCYVGHSPSLILPSHDYTKSFYQMKNDADVKAISKRDKSVEMDEVLAELGQLEEEDAEEACSPIPRKPKQIDIDSAMCASPPLSNVTPDTEIKASVIQLLDTVVHTICMMEEQPRKFSENRREHDKPRPSEDFDDGKSTRISENHSRVFRRGMPKELKNTIFPKFKDVALSPISLTVIRSDKKVKDIGIQCYLPELGGGQLSKLHCRTVHFESCGAILKQNESQISSQESSISNSQRKRQQHEYPLRSRQKCDLS